MLLIPNQYFLKFIPYLWSQTLIKLFLFQSLEIELKVNFDHLFDIVQIFYIKWPNTFELIMK